MQNAGVQNIRKNSCKLFFTLVLLLQTCRNAELYEHEMATCLRRSTDLLILFINIWMAGKMQWHYEIIDNCYVFSLDPHLCSLQLVRIRGILRREGTQGIGVCLPRQFCTVNYADFSSHHKY